MQGSWRAHGLRGRLRRCLQAAAMISLLTGCSWTDDLSNSLFGGGSSSPSNPQPVAGPGEQPGTQTKTPTGTQPAQSQTYPNLGTVPSQAPTTSTSAQRQQMTSGLIADNQNVGYSQQPVAPQPADQSGVAPPAPAPVPAAVVATSEPAPSAAVTTTEPAPSAAVTTTEPSQSAAVTTTEPSTSAAVTTTNTTTNAASSATIPAPSGQTTMAETAPAPAETPQPVSPPTATAGVTPLAPPPNPIPPASQTATATYGNGSVTVDTSQIGGGPLPGTAPPLPYYSTSAGAVAGGGQPVAVIFFADGSAALSGHDLTVLRDVYLIQQQQGGHLRIVGNASMHTATLDPSQHDQVNFELSVKRANAVARALINMGVPDGSIAVMAQGSQRPVFYEFMPTGEAGNRRVEIYLDR